MLFNDINDIKDSIRKNLSNYLKDNMHDIDNKMILSLLRSYLQELKSIKEIVKYIAAMDNNKIIISIDKDDKIENFIIDIDIEIRKIKINKIKNIDIKNFYHHLFF